MDIEVKPFGFWTSIGFGGQELMYVEENWTGESTKRKTKQSLIHNKKTKL